MSDATEETRRIGLSLGADECWPVCYEEILARLDLRIPVNGRRVRFEVERTEIEAFNLQWRSRFDVVIDRLTHWYGLRREGIKKAIILDGIYVLNNPWSLQAMEKPTGFSAMMRLGMPVPETWLLPQKTYEPRADLELTLERYARLFDLGKIGKSIGYPLFMKPYSGGGWIAVSRIENEEELHRAYDKSDSLLMHLQKGITGWDCFVRSVGLGPQVRPIRYTPEAPLHERYGTEVDFLDAADASLVEDMTLTINSFFGWEFNSCEALRRDGVWHPIDFTNACPDSQVTSIHFHLPWMVKAMVRWSLFCAATQRRMRPNLDWEAYFDIAEENIPYREKLSRYAAVARSRFETDRFHEFCERHLSHLDEVAFDVLGGAKCHESVRRKVESLFPRYEWDEFTDYFWDLVQKGRTE